VCLRDFNDIADYLLEVEASLTRKISRQQRIDEIQELRLLLRYLSAVDRNLRNAEAHRLLEIFIQRIRVCDESIQTLIERGHYLSHSQNGVGDQ